MEEDDGFGFAPAAPALVSLLPFSPSVSHSPRRLSSSFTKPSRPVRAARQLAWVDLRGRLVGAEECSSARAIFRGLNREEEAVAWDMFSPIQRILVVAVIAVAAAESKKNRRIMQLNKSVQLRDQVLSSMQQKLDSLCDQLNNVKEQPQPQPSSEVFAFDKIKIMGCGCWQCDHHQRPPNNLMDNNLVNKTSSADEIFKYKMEVEPEERRMSDLSWNSSVTSSMEILQGTLEQDVFNLKRQCEEKDATIKELSASVQSSNTARSKRVSELEDIVKRKNSTIVRLKKDLVILEQKLVQQSRLLRPSTSSAVSPKAPVLAYNLVYDMDSTTSASSSSSSDSDGGGPENRGRQPPVAKIQEFLPPAQNSDHSSRQPPVAKIEETPAQYSGDHSSRRIQKPTAPAAKTPAPMAMPPEWRTRSRPSSPLQEKIMNQTTDAVSSFKPRQLLPPSGDGRKSRRRAQNRSNDATPQKRWM